MKDQDQEKLCVKTLIRIRSTAHAHLLGDFGLDGDLKAGYLIGIHAVNAMIGNVIINQQNPEL